MTETVIFFLGIIVGFVNMALLVENTGRMLDIDKQSKSKLSVFFSYFLRFSLAGLFLYSAVNISGICLITALAGYLVPLLITVIFPFQVVVNIKNLLLRVKFNA